MFGSREMHYLQSLYYVLFNCIQVTLPCRVENRIGLLQWTRDGFGLGDTRQLSGYSRYRLVGSDDESKLVLGAILGYINVKAIILLVIF